MRGFEIAFRIVALIGLGASVLLLGEYMGEPSSLCGPGGGCDQVRQSTWARPLGVPLPVLGILYFALAFSVSVVPGFRRVRLPLAALGAAAGAAFLWIQGFEIGAFCAFCVVVDACALALGGLALALARQPAPRPAPVRWALHASLLVAVSAASLGLHWLGPRRPPEPPSPDGMPEAVAALQRPGVVTVVEFLDFQCPACRAQHARFAAVLPDYGGRVRVVLKHLPLPQHPFAEPAARAHVCAERQGAASGKAMADALFAVGRPDAGTLPALVARLGLDAGRFAACLESPATSRRLRRDRADAEAAGVAALPTFWIAGEPFQGVQDVETLRSSIERALAGGAVASAAEPARGRP